MAIQVAGRAGCSPVVQLGPNLIKIRLNFLEGFWGVTWIWEVFIGCRNGNRWKNSDSP